MPAIVRNPFAAAVVALLVVAVAVAAFIALDNWEEGEGRGDRGALEVRARSAPVVAANVARFEEHRRRVGRGYAAGETLLADWLGEYPRDERRRVLELARYHSLRTETRPGGFTVRTVSAPETSGWFRIDVVRSRRLVDATCGGDPAPGCVDAHWRVESHGVKREYLLGR